jgi:hypothetical protein
VFSRRRGSCLAVEPGDKSTELMRHSFQVHLGCTRLGDDYEIPGLQKLVLVKPIPLPDESLGPVSIRRIAHRPLAGRDADSSGIFPTWSPSDQESLGTKDPRSTTVLPIFAGPTNANRDGKSSILAQGYLVEIETARLFRPRRRRRDRTRRPALEAIRRRKPWVRLREMLLGWKVRFMASTPKWLSS